MHITIFFPIFFIFFEKLKYFILFGKKMSERLRMSKKSSTFAVAKVKDLTNAKMIK